MISTSISIQPTATASVCRCSGSPSTGTRTDYNLIRYMSPKMREILLAMGANEADVTTSKELRPYTIAPYQSTHNTGGAIMGSDPGNSVTNKYGQVWDTPNVHRDREQRYSRRTLA
ncbi:MAG: hypothetical protein KatS3mg059_0458 [Thermomicrobiales bacterium]|nr:MAG: hypothetical protein KatS3mg059_0458 [Thermomicrobiales bacterium]